MPARHASSGRHASVNRNVSGVRGNGGLGGSGTGPGGSGAGPPNPSDIAPTSGGTGGSYPAIIHGVGFNNPSVRFGPSAFATLGVSDFPATKIVISSVPAGAAGTVAVTVINGSDSQQKDVPGGFLYKAPPPPPTVSTFAPTHAPSAGGTPCHITGINFVGSVIKWNGVTLGGVSNTSTTIDFTIPAGTFSGVVDVDVANSDGQHVDLGNVFQYDAQPPPTVDHTYPAFGPVAGGNATNVYGTGFDPTGGVIKVSFNGNQALDADVHFQDQFTINVDHVPGHVAGNVKVTVVNGNGDTAFKAGAYSYAPPSSPVNIGFLSKGGSAVKGSVKYPNGAGGMTFQDPDEFAAVQLLATDQYRSRVAFRSEINDATTPTMRMLVYDESGSTTPEEAAADTLAKGLSWCMYNNENAYKDPQGHVITGPMDQSSPQTWLNFVQANLIRFHAVTGASGIKILLCPTLLALEEICDDTSTPTWLSSLVSICDGILYQIEAREGNGNIHNKFVIQNSGKDVPYYVDQIMGEAVNQGKGQFKTWVQVSANPPFPGTIVWDYTYMVADITAINNKLAGTPYFRSAPAYYNIFYNKGSQPSIDIMQAGVSSYGRISLD